MDCKRAEELFSDHYDRALSAEDQAAVEDHLRSCVACSREYRHFKKSLDLLRTSSQFETSTIFAGGVVAAARTETALPPAPPKPAPRPFPWAWVPAMAALVVAAFLGGLLVRKPPEAAVRETIREREVPGPAVEKPLTRADKERILREEFGLVHDGNRWLPKSMKESFEKGFVCVGGEMMSRDDAFAKLSEGRAKPPDKIDIRAEVDKEMARLGYEKVGTTFVPREWLEAWTKGLVQVGPDAWMTREEFRNDFMKRYNLVEYPEGSGTIMSREHRDELVAQRIVRRPDTATADNEVTAALAGLEIGPPAAFKGLTLYPILAPREAGEPDFVNLAAALQAGTVEIADGGPPFEVRVTNSGDRAVLVAEGEILAGGRYSRVVTEDTLVPPSKRPVAVPVACVEPSALRKDERFTGDSGHYFAAYGLRKVLLAEAGQGAAWAHVTRQIDLAGGKAKSQGEVYRHVLAELMEYRTFFADLPERFPSAVGVVVCTGESVEVAELFRNRTLFAAYFERVLNAAALQSALRARGKPARASRVPASVAGVRQTIESAFFAKIESRGDSRILRGDGRPSGRAFLVGARPVRVVLFAEAVAGDPEWRVECKVPPEKLKRVLDDLDRRSREGAGPARAQALYETSLFHFKEATALLVGHLSEPDAALRRAAIAALGRRQDPRAVQPLLELLDRTRRDLLTFTAVVSALARIGDERAVGPFLRHLDGDATQVRATLSVLPELLLQIKAAEPLEKAVTRLVLLHEEAEAIVKGVNVAGRWSGGEAAGIQTATRSALEAVTGEGFDSAARAREWWNKRENREKFLRERTGR